MARDRLRYDALMPLSNSVVPLRRTDNTKAVVFVHGVFGDAQRSFGRFPELLVGDRWLPDWDVFKFSYPSRLRPADPSLATVTNSSEAA